MNSLTKYTMLSYRITSLKFKITYIDNIILISCYYLRIIYRYMVTDGALYWYKFTEDLP